MVNEIKKVIINDKPADLKFSEDKKRVKDGTIVYISNGKNVYDRHF